MREEEVPYLLTRVTTTTRLTQEQTDIINENIEEVLDEGGKVALDYFGNVCLIIDDDFHVILQ